MSSSTDEGEIRDEGHGELKTPGLVSRCRHQDHYDPRQHYRNRADAPRSAYRGYGSDRDARVDHGRSRVTYDDLDWNSSSQASGQHGEHYRVRDRGSRNDRRGRDRSRAEGHTRDRAPDKATDNNRHNQQRRRSRSPDRFERFRRYNQPADSHPDVRGNNSHAAAYNRAAQPSAAKGQLQVPTATNVETPAHRDSNIGPAPTSRTPVNEPTPESELEPLVPEPLDEEAEIERRRKRRDMLYAQKSFQEAVDVENVAKEDVTIAKESDGKQVVDSVQAADDVDMLHAGQVVQGGTQTTDKAQGSKVIETEAVSRADIKVAREEMVKEVVGTAQEVDAKGAADAAAEAKAIGNDITMGKAEPVSEKAGGVGGDKVQEEHADLPDYEAVCDDATTDQRSAVNAVAPDTPESPDDEALANGIAIEVPHAEAEEEAQGSDSRGLSPEGGDDEFDMFDDDCDGEVYAAYKERRPKTVEQPRGLLEGDDSDGYYKARIGEVLNDRYEIMSTLGQGVFARVVGAKDMAKNNRVVAVKIVRNNDALRRHAHTEINILQKLNEADPGDKKSIVRFQGSFEHCGHLCMVFEGLEMNLRQAIKKYGNNVGINLDATRRYARQIFVALDHLRKNHIIHADLKPDNILINDNRQILKVCDLGTAIDRSDAATAHAQLTPYLVSRFYRAPEVILGMDYDYGVDMWSIGCTLFELFTSKILFPGASNNQMLKLIFEKRGRMHWKLYKRGRLSNQYFDDQDRFISVEVDRSTNKLTQRAMTFPAARHLGSRIDEVIRDLKTPANRQSVDQFMDLLDKCLLLHPEKRITPADALRHPFLKPPTPAAPTAPVR
ncbi:serine/threonine-protein kinase prp4 [Ophiocordyceps camponoti-floridani]|uniref:non-specific serine/threonine protein kinase n=1 Tax=Ophiocordyceps camponoti-floridani TaxID=2030778 RepID=A0A8H4Q753_9HYPO|nr:serine/threonine-protein kinase prp4 [Ophiocordyceps camponoti-floridani]